MSGRLLLAVIVVLGMGVSSAGAEVPRSSTSGPAPLMHHHDAHHSLGEGQITAASLGDIAVPSCVRRTTLGL